MSNRRTYSMIIYFLASLVAHSGYAQDLKSLRNQKPFDIKGNVSATAQFYAVNGIENRRKPFTWYLTGSPTIKIYGIAIPFSITVSEQERSFSQPFNRYGASPTYKWIKVHMGYRNVRFSDFTLGGAAFLGAGVELTPKNLRLGFVYGQFKRSVLEDDTGSDPRYKYLRPTYQRLGYGGKVGFGKPKAFVDFSFFKAVDIMNSIQNPSIKSGVTPMENLSIAAKTHFGFLKNRLVFDFDLGASLLTKDIRKYDIKITDEWQRTALKILAINETSAYFKAIKAGSSYRMKMANIRLDYQRIDPNFQTLGSYFFQNDIEQLTISPSVSLIKGKASLSGSLGRSRDNLNGKKTNTSIRKVGAINAALQPVKNLNIALGYSNFGVGQSRGLADIFNDSLSISVVNSSYNGNLSYGFGSKSKRQSLALNVALQSTTDYSQFSSALSGNASLMSSVNYSMNIPAHKINVSGALSYVKMNTGGRKIINIGPNFSATKTWKNGLYRTSLNHNSQARQTNGLNDGLMSNTGINLGTILKKQTLAIGLNYLYNQYKTQSDGLNFRNFSEYRGSVTYGVRF